MKFARLADWLQWQEKLSPTAIDLGLERVQLVWERLGRPRPAPCVISVAGTNGKGSCVAFVDAMLRAGGYRTGVYTSPHLVRYNERVALAGQPVTDETLMAAFERVEAARGDTRLTYFEFGTLAALDIFARAGLDAAVLEVGLGGRLDAVNLIDADAMLITTIDIDHAEWLGPDRESIGREKAGILRRGRPAVFGGAVPPRSLLEVAADLDVPLWVAGQDFGHCAEHEGWRWWGGGLERRGLPWPALRGAHQLANAAASLAVLERLADRLPLDQLAVREGLLGAGVRGRFEVLPGRPRVLLDVAHNPEAAAALASNLAPFAAEGRIRAVFGALSDKDVEGIVRPLAASVEHWHLAPPQGGRALAPEVLARRVGAVVGDGRLTLHASVSAACDAALDSAAMEDTLLVFGSFVVVGEAIGHLEASRDKSRAGQLI